MATVKKTDPRDLPPSGAELAVTTEKDSAENLAEIERLWDSIRGGAFEARVRERFGVDDTWRVEVEMSGGGQFQIGDYTWDSEPYRLEVVATAMKIDWVRDRYFHGGTLRPRLVGDYKGRKTYETGSLPEIWAWLEEEVG